MARFPCPRLLRFSLQTLLVLLTGFCVWLGYNLDWLRARAGVEEECFGVRNNFSGSLSEEQERSASECLRGAFHVESVGNVTSAELAEQMKWKVKVAEESRGGAKYVAVRDDRCVDFGNGVSGMMVVIERYRVIEK